MNPAHIALVTGWLALLGGVVSGSIIGMRFHRDEWLGGYASFRRRLMRLGHIAFFGLGFVNLMFAFSVRAAPLPVPVGEFAAAALALGAITMPATCFLTAWRERFRELFPIPVTFVLAGIVSLLVGWGIS